MVEGTHQVVVKSRFWTPSTIFLAILSAFTVGILIGKGLAVKRYNERLLQANSTTPGEIPPDSKTKELPYKKEPATSTEFVTKEMLKAEKEIIFSRMRRYVLDKIREAKSFALKCFNEPTPIRTLRSRGRTQNDVCAYQYEHAILYQLSHRNCSALNACNKSFSNMKDGYANPRSLYDYMSKHKLETQAAKEALAIRAADAGLSLLKFYETHHAFHSTNLQELKS